MVQHSAQTALNKHLSGHTVHQQAQDALDKQRLGVSPLATPPPDVEAALSWRLALNVGLVLAQAEGVGSLPTPDIIMP